MNVPAGQSSSGWLVQVADLCELVDWYVFAGQAWQLNELSMYWPFEQGSARCAFNFPAAVLHADAPAGKYGCTWCTANPLGRCNTPKKKGQYNKQPVSIHVRATVSQRSPYPPILHSFTQPPHDAQHDQQSTARTAPPCKEDGSHTPIVRHRMLQMMCPNQKPKHAVAANDPASASIVRISDVASSSPEAKQWSQRTRAHQSRRQHHNMSAGIIYIPKTSKSLHAHSAHTLVKVRVSQNHRMMHSKSNSARERMRE